MCDTHSDESKPDPRSSLPESGDRIPAIHVSRHVVVSAIGTMAMALTVFKEIFHQAVKDNFNVVSLSLSVYI